MPKHQHIFQRNGTWYYRRHVPLDIRHSFGKADIVKSLRTNDEAVARRLANIEDVSSDEEFASHRVSSPGETTSIAIATPSIKQACDVKFKKIIETDFTYRAKIHAKANADPDSFYSGKILSLPDTDYFYHRT